MVTAKSNAFKQWRPHGFATKGIEWKPTKWKAKEAKFRRQSHPIKHPFYTTLL